MGSFDEQFSRSNGKNGYNLLRIPYTNEMFNAGVMPQGIDYGINPDLEGLTPIQVLDKLVEKAGARGMKIILDRHRPTSAGQSELWYTSEISESRWINDWKMLAERYLNNDTIIGADLHNEPHGIASWGSGDVSTDWRLAAERGGNAILEVNPHWLIIVEGVQSNVNGSSDNYWWGGNLQGVKNDPVRFNVPHQLVYETHDYGPGVAHQPWFDDPSFPDNMPEVWDKYWAYIHKQKIAPVLVGEFGGREVGYDTQEGKWQNKLTAYIADNNFYWTYWCWNPNSSDTGGVLLDDWITIYQDKQNMLDQIIADDPPFRELYEAESLKAVVSSADSRTQFTDLNISGLHGDKLDANAVDDYIIYDIDVPVAQTYNVKVGIKKQSSRGIFQLSIGGWNQGTEQDNYSSADTYVELDLGDKIFTVTGTKQFKFTITGKNENSSGYTLGLDYIRLVPVKSSSLHEAENLTAATSGDSRFQFSDENMSGGMGDKLSADAVGDYITYDVNVSAAGTYTILIGAKKQDTRGIFQLSIGGWNQGTEQDNYSSTVSYVEFNLGDKTFNEAGTKNFKFTIAGKNTNSLGYTLGLDYIKLVPVP